VDLLIDQGRARDAFAVVERMRAQSLEDALVQGKVDAGATLTAEEKAHQRSLESRLSNLNRELLHATRPEPALRVALEEARRDLELFDAQLYMTHPSLSRSGIDPGDPLVTAAEALPPGAQALEYTVLDRSTVLFTVRRTASGVAVSAHR